MFAVIAHRAAAIAVPVVNLALRGQVEFDGHGVGLALGALHFAVQAPAVVFGRDAQVQHLLRNVEFTAPRKSARVGQVFEHIGVKPQAVGTHNFYVSNKPLALVERAQAAIKFVVLVVCQTPKGAFSPG